MIAGNLRHLRLFLAVAKGGSVTRAAAEGLVTQPAVTQAIAKLETQANCALLQRRPQGLFPTVAGTALQSRAKRAFDLLDGAATDINPRLVRRATRAQLTALIATAEAQNFSLAAKRLGVAQPTVHRAVSMLELDAGRDLFSRSAHGVIPTHPCTALARAARLAFVELDQASAELAEMVGQDGGEITIGAMPLSRSYVLPQALALFRAQRPQVTLRILDGSYDTLLEGLRRGEIDLLIGALRSPLPIADVVQERLFDDKLVLLAGHGHPVLARAPDLRDLRRYPWIVPRQGTPARMQFEAMFLGAGLSAPSGVIETGSTTLMREMLRGGPYLACISQAQASSEVARDLVKAVDFTIPAPARPIGLTLRAGFIPTPAQSAFLAAVRGQFAQD